MSVILNDVQNQVAKFANKCINFEDTNVYLSPPRHHSVNLSDIPIHTGVVYFELDGMLEVRDGIKEYVSEGEHTVANLKRQTENLRSVWQDTQFNDYHEMLTEVCDKIKIAISELHEYEVYLTKKINDLVGSGS